MPYLNPLTIISTVSFAMIFIHLEFQSHIVNFLGKSAFAVFLLHTNFNIAEYFKGINTYIYENYSGIIVIGGIFLVCCAWYIAAVVIDHPRIWLWQRFQRDKTN